MPRLGWVALLLVLVAVLTVGGFLAVDRLAGDRQDHTVVEKPELGRAAVVRTDLRRSETFPAFLRYGRPRTVFAGFGGIVTKVPEEGAVLAMGDPLIEIDGQPVFVFHGERPMWRSLGPARGGSVTEGADVEQLEVNLAALGYSSEIVPDRVFDEETARAVERWRSDAGLEAGGSVELGRIVYIEGPIRVGRSLVEAGAHILAGAAIVEVSGTDQEVLMELPVDRRDRIAVGDALTVQMPDDTRAVGTVDDIGAVVFSPAADRRGEDFVEVSIFLDDPSLGESFHGYPVDVEIVTEEAVGVLAVPVKALVALSEGGYAVEVERDGELTLVGVDTGMYADGLVEVRGDISAGDRVVVPK